MSSTCTVDEIRRMRGSAHTSGAKDKTKATAKASGTARRPVAKASPARPRPRPRPRPKATQLAEAAQLDESASAAGLTAAAAAAVVTVAYDTGPVHSFPPPRHYVKAGPPPPHQQQHVAVDDADDADDTEGDDDVHGGGGGGEVMCSVCEEVGRADDDGWVRIAQAMRGRAARAETYVCNSFCVVRFMGRRAGACRYLQRVMYTAFAALQHLPDSDITPFEAARASINGAEDFADMGVYRDNARIDALECLVAASAECGGPDRATLHKAVMRVPLHDFQTDQQLGLLDTSDED